MVRWRHSSESTLLKQRLEQLQQRLQSSLHQRRTDMNNLRKILDAISPQQILERGYALVEHTERGHLIQDRKQVSTGENITVTLKRGRLFARVEAKGD